MPVRLETRFKDVQLPGAAAPTPQLLVRIYPDDCWVDGFDPRLTESEAASARAYWIAMWEAGGVEQQERAAWRSLVRSHGAGRAAWVVEQFTPVNLPQRPTKTRPEDIVLTIATEAPLSSAEEAAAAAFWRDAWLADGDRSKLTAAHAGLTGAVGAARAAQIVAHYRPDNFETPLEAGIDRQAVTVLVAQVVFAAPDTREQAWSGAPEVRILPDRFVFVGYRQFEPPVIAVGRPVPSSVVVAPESIGSGRGAAPAGRFRQSRVPRAARMDCRLREGRSDRHGTSGRALRGAACGRVRPRPRRRLAGKRRRESRPDGARDPVATPRVQSLRPEPAAAGHSHQQHGRGASRWRDR